jgi:hypothetical protein
MYFKTEILCKSFARKASRPILRHTGIHLVMQIRIALIPLIIYTPPNDLATHNYATFAKFKTCLLVQIIDDSVKKITTKTVC